MTRERGDAGFSLTEIVVSMSILSVVTAITVGSIAQIYNSVNRIDNVSVARDQLANSFRRLDKEIRYADWIDPPTQDATGAWTVEYALPSGSTPCRQLSYKNGKLSIASYAEGATPGAGGVIASNLALVPGVAPFTLYPANSHPFATSGAAEAGVGSQYAPEHDQIRVRFNGVWGRTTLPFDVTFTAQNNTADTPDVNECSL